MKKSIFLSAAILASLISFSACNKGFDGDESTASFETEAFENFLWKKQAPVEIEAVINTKFDECEALEKPLVLQLCDDDAKAIPVSVAQLYVNGEISSDNTIIIDPNRGKEETDIKIVLDDSQIHDTRTFTWNLQVVENPGLVKVNDRAVGKDPWVRETTINWKNKHIANPLRVGTDISLLTILAIIAAWILLVQLTISRFKSDQIRTIKFTIEDGNPKCINSKNSSLAGSKEIILTRTSAKQGFLKMLFFGKTSYVKIDELPCEVKFTPGRKKGQVVLDTRHPGYTRNNFETYTEGEKNEIKVLNSIAEGTAMKIEFNYKGR